jgi:PGF-pre-PGF domain-containing protein
MANYVRFFTLTLLAALLLFPVGTSSALLEARKPTQLTLLPETFTVASNGSVTFTVKLTSEGKPLVGKQILFAASIGSVSPNIAVTDENGVASTLYTAPTLSFRVDVTIIASFLGDLTYEGSMATSKGVIEPALPIIQLAGASFPLPKTLEDAVSFYRKTIPRNVLDMLPIALPSKAFILATPEDVYLVFADVSDSGLAAVEGWKLPLYIWLADMWLGVIAAKSVRFEKEGQPATISDILKHPDDYVFKLVKIGAERRQVSLLYDSDKPPYIEFPVTVGYLVEKPVKPLDTLSRFLERGRDFALRLDEHSIRSLLKEGENQTLQLFNFEYEYWYDAPTVTNGIIIPANHQIFKLIHHSMPVIGRFTNLDGKVVLYDVKTEITYEEISSVNQLEANLEKMVKITANCYGGYISVQETLRKSAEKEIPVDVRVEGLAAWSEISATPSRGQIVMVAGVSSFHQDKPFVNATGVFELIGRVVSTKEISASLPEGVALLLCRAKKVGEIDFEKIAQQAQDKIRDEVSKLYWVLQDIYPYKTQPNIPYKVPGRVFSPKAPIFVKTPKEIPEISVERNFTINIASAAPETPIKLNITNSHISSISITLKGLARNVTIFFEKLVEKPPQIPKPPGLVYAYHEISINISKDVIKSANITFYVSKEWLIANNAKAENVTLVRYHAVEWTKLPTRVVGENATHFQFLSQTPGFSTYAIIAETAPPTVTVTQTLTTTVTQTITTTVTQPTTITTTITQPTTVTTTATLTQPVTTTITETKTTTTTATLTQLTTTTLTQPTTVTKTEATTVTQTTMLTTTAIKEVAVDATPYIAAIIALIIIIIILAILPIKRRRI